MKKIYLLINILLCLFIVGCNKEKKIESIIADKNEIVLNIGEKETISYECLPEKTSQEVTWSTSDYNIVTVSDGIVTAVNKGTAIITITSCKNNEIKTTVKVTVISRNYNITYALDEGILNDDVPNSYEENVGLETLPTPTRDGYEFDGWYLNDTLVTKIESTYNKDVTLVAKWTKIIKYYNITYILDEGLFNEDVVNTYEENVGLEILPTPTRDGYEFDGSYLNDTLVTKIESTYNKDVTLVAKWTKIIKYYNITYILNGGSFTSDVVYEYEDGIGLEILPTAEKDGYEFLGWFYKDNLINKIDADINKDVTLSARWKELVNEDTDKA